jgi:hypothetical protein
MTRAGLATATRAKESKQSFAFEVLSEQTDRAAVRTPSHIEQVSSYRYRTCHPLNYDIRHHANEKVPRLAKTRGLNEYP